MFMKDKKGTSGYDFSFDIWSFGIFMYELVVGEPPFGHAESTLDDMKNQMMRGEVKMMDYFSKEFKSLIESLLEKNVARRPNIDKVMAHPFFKKIDFAKMEKKLVKPPFKPKIANLGKVSNAEKLWLK